MIALLDYGAGNVRSVINAIESLGETVKTVGGPGDILSAEKLVFPGVGAFGSMIRSLHEKKFLAPLKAYLDANRPFLGICLGLQALFEHSEEAPHLGGLGLLAGSVKRFDTGLSVPHIGWNGINVKKPSRIFDSLAGTEKFYFVHSYYPVPTDPTVVATETTYGPTFASSVARGNVFAGVFHPEKSQHAGARLIGHFLGDVSWS